MSHTRRMFVLQSSVLALGATGLRLARAAGLSCPPGEVVAKRTFTEAVLYTEGNVNIVGSGGGLKLPKKVTLESLECVPAPPPPPPKTPPPKSSYWTPYDLTDVWTDGSVTDGIDASLFYVATSIPGFATLTSDPATMAFTARLANGSTVNSSNQLVRDGNGFRLANPAAVDYWMSNIAKDKISTRWEISGIGVQGLQAGSGTYGVAQFFNSTAISAFSGFIQVSSGSGATVRTKNY